MRHVGYLNRVTDLIANAVFGAEPDLRVGFGPPYAAYRPPGGKHGKGKWLLRVSPRWIEEVYESDLVTVDRRLVLSARPVVPPEGADAAWVVSSCINFVPLEVARYGTTKNQMQEVDVRERCVVSYAGEKALGLTPKDALQHVLDRFTDGLGVTGGRR